MKLHHSRKFNGTQFESVTHFGFKDSAATSLAKAIRERLNIKARVITDAGTGFTHVFVECGHWDEACDIAEEFV